jgi:hypothetical protein
LTFYSLYFTLDELKITSKGIRMILKGLRTILKGLRTILKGLRMMLKGLRTIPIYYPVKGLRAATLVIIIPGIDISLLGSL